MHNYKKEDNKMPTNETDILKTLLPGLSTKYSGNLYTANLPKAPIEEIDPGPGPVPPTPTPTDDRTVSIVEIPGDHRYEFSITENSTTDYTIPYKHIEIDTNPEIKASQSLGISINYGNSTVTTFSVSGATNGIINIDITAYKKEGATALDLPTYYVRINGYTKIAGAVSYSSLFTKTTSVNSPSDLSEFKVSVMNLNFSDSNAIIVSADAHEIKFDK